MDLLGRIFRRETKASTLASPSSELLALFGATPTAAGQAVNAETALRCPAVYACVKIIAEPIAQLPLILYRRDGDDRERAADHPLYAILHDQPNDWTTAPEFRLDMQTAVLLHGNAYAFIGRDSRDQIRELVQIPSDCVTVETDPQTMEPEYQVTIDGQETRYRRDRIFHLRTIGRRPNVGDAPIWLAREAIGLYLALEAHAARLMGSGARPSGLLKHPKTLTPETIEKLRKSFNRTFGGENAGGTAVLEDGMDFQTIQFSSVDMQFLEMRRHQVAEIARVFRVPLHLLQELERATHNNAESMGRQFLSLTLMPWLKLWESAIRRSLLAEDERGDLYAEFLADDLARADFAARFQAYSQAVTNGLLNPNEVRAAENRPPYAGGEAFRAPLNTAPIGQEPPA